LAQPPLPPQAPPFQLRGPVDGYMHSARFAQPRGSEDSGDGHLESARFAHRHGLDDARAAIHGGHDQSDAFARRHGLDRARAHIHKTRERAATYIQSCYRGSLARRELAQRRDSLARFQQDQLERDQAALQIQSFYRGWQARHEAACRRYSLLAEQEQDLMEQYAREEEAAKRIQAQSRDLAARRSCDCWEPDALQHREPSPGRPVGARQAPMAAAERGPAGGRSCDYWESGALECRELSLVTEDLWTEALLMRQRKAGRLSEVSRLEQLVERCSDGRYCGSCDLRILGLQSILQALGRLCRAVTCACDTADTSYTPKGRRSLLADLAEILHDCSTGLPRKGFTNLEEFGQEVDDFVAYLAAVGHPRRTQEL